MVCRHASKLGKHCQRGPRQRKFLLLMFVELDIFTSFCGLLGNRSYSRDSSTNDVLHNNVHTHTHTLNIKWFWLLAVYFLAACFSYIPIWKSLIWYGGLVWGSDHFLPLTQLANEILHNSKVALLLFTRLSLNYCLTSIKLQLHPIYLKSLL